MEAEESGGGGVMDCYDCKAKSVCAAVVQRGSVMCLMNRMRYSERGGKGAAVSVPVCDARPVLDWRRMRL